MRGKLLRIVAGLAVGAVAAAMAPFLSAVGNESGNDTIGAYAYATADRGGWASWDYTNDEGASAWLYFYVQRTGHAGAGVGDQSGVQASNDPSGGYAFADLSSCSESGDCTDRWFSGPAGGFTADPTLKSDSFDGTLTDVDRNTCRFQVSWSGADPHTGSFNWSEAEQHAFRAEGAADLWRTASAQVKASCVPPVGASQNGGVFADLGGQTGGVQQVTPDLPL